VEEHAPDDEIEHFGQREFQPRVAPVLPPPADDINIMCRHILVHLLQFARVVLQIAIHRQDELTSRESEAAFERDRFAEIPPKRIDPEVGMLAREPLQQGERVVGRPIIDEHDLVAATHRRQCRFDRGRDRGYALAFITNRDHDRKTRRLVVHSSSGASG